MKILPEDSGDGSEDEEDEDDDADDDADAETGSRLVGRLRTSLVRPPVDVGADLARLRPELKLEGVPGSRREGTSRTLQNGCSLAQKETPIVSQDSN